LDCFEILDSLLILNDQTSKIYDTRFSQWWMPHPTATHISLTLEQQIADELGGNLLGRAAEEGLGGAGRSWVGVVAMEVAL